MITKDEVKRIAKLSMLELKEEDVDKFCNQFNEILGYMKEIDGLNLESQEAVFHVGELKNVFREDEVKPSTDNELALKNAPDPADRAFRVPKVIER
ncbi:Asp-tRNA(Asn)/Glu-tRNA(Gln) amidotransferase subunit GatC [Hippea maritima]|uniref:Aspartyl/glutamyl-tRNA(Asn/Gln) amidotransferase subunit C n=1 Tax=Hippea maritima (strain ATCC 700847 / DSM 10411 / MH2) TaxID=760142 RepID=F2LWT1_HIPMA|nr:Asp-tRNA(Asn)/Glu-tRNA(Gln) amidotransferase subunit GatC [Hippea maritima]AEA33059.1 Aspartyl/glutamyl-tRNA(Asn/Gln) amidotransferase subunit C [Hippea maritima DSM 10411]